MAVDVAAWWLGCSPDTSVPCSIPAGDNLLPPPPFTMHGASGCCVSVLLLSEVKAKKRQKQIPKMKVISCFLWLHKQNKTVRRPLASHPVCGLRNLPWTNRTSAGYPFQSPPPPPNLRYQRSQDGFCQVMSFELFPQRYRCLLDPRFFDKLQ